MTGRPFVAMFCVSFLGSPGGQTARTRDPVTPPLTFQLSRLEKDAITICEPGHMRTMRCEEFIPKMGLGNAGQMTIEDCVPSLVFRSIDYTWQRLTRAEHFAITSFYSYKTCRPRFNISVLQIRKGRRGFKEAHQFAWRSQAVSLEPRLRPASTYVQNMCHYYYYYWKKYNSLLTEYIYKIDISYMECLS